MTPQPRRSPRPRAPRWKGRLGWLAGALLVALAPRVQAQAAYRAPEATARIETRDTSYVDAVIRVDIEDGPSDVLPALASDTLLLLPVHKLADMAEIHVAAFALRDSAVLVLEPGAIRVRFVPGAGLITRGAERVPYDSMDVAWSDGDLFVATGLLDRLLGVRTKVSWADLSVMIAHAAGLPVVMRLRRERRRRLLYHPTPSGRAFDIPLQQRALDGGLFTWQLTAATSGPTDQFALNLGLGASLLGGSAEVRPQMWSNHGLSGGELLASWSRVWTDSRWLRQTGVGDIQTGGLRARLIEGVSVTNAPFIRSSEFDVENIVGKVAPGWEVELYDHGRLMGYADANALGAFRVPLQLRYGQNPFDLVMYGPSGQTVRETRTIRVPSSRLPAGDLEYAFAAGRCRFDPCNGIMSADLRYGLSKRVTLQGGSDAFGMPAGGTLWQPYAVVSAGVLPALNLTGEAVVNGHLRLAADYEPSPDLQASGDYTRFAAAGAAFNGAGNATGETDASLFWRPGWLQGGLFFQGTGLYSTGPGLRQRVLRLSATRQVGQVRYSLGVLSSGLSGSAAVDTSQFALDASVDALLLGPYRWLRTSTVGAQIGYDPAAGLTAVRGSFGRRISQALRVDAALGWYRVGGLSLEIGLSTASRGPQIGTRSRLSPEGSSALTYAYGSVAWDPRTGLVRMGDGADLDRAGISGVLFRDDNGNGVQDPGEPGIANVPIWIGGWPAKTDADGRFSAWNLIPFVPVRISVDTLALPDPRLLLPAPVIRVRPTPNAFGSIEVPVVVGAEVSGYVVMGDHAVSGVPVLLRDLNTGREITLPTFADGAFYKEAVPPGDYEVTLPNAVLDRLHAYAPPLSIFVPPGPGDKRFEDLQLRLEPRQ